jgi:hypothetical protein
MLGHVMTRSRALAVRGYQREGCETGSSGCSDLIEAIAALAGHVPSLMRQSPVAVLLALSLLAASSLALQTPTDPLWSPGIYDGDDLDDAIALLGDPGEVAAPLGPLTLFVPGGARVSLVASTASATSEVPASLARHFRSPPLP